MKIYSISGRTTKGVVGSSLNQLMDYYQVNHEVMEKDDRIHTLENIVDLMRIKEKILGD